MNKVKLNYFCLLILILLFIIILILQNNYSAKEGFTSRLREMYRPYFRNIRLFFEKVYDNIKTKFLLFNRKIGLN